MELVSFKGVPLSGADVSESYPMGTRSNLVDLADGAFDEDGQRVNLQPYQITRTFKITDREKRGVKINEKTDAFLRALAGGRGVLKARMRDGTFRQTFAKFLNVERARRLDDKNYQELTVTWQVDYPYWLASEDEPLYMDHGYVMDAGKFMDGHYDLITLNASSVAATIVNGGMLPVRRGKIILIPASGASLTDLTILNTANMMQLRYTGEIANPKVLVLDLLSKSAKLDAVNAYANIEIRTDQMDWMQLEVGDNPLVITSGSRTGTTEMEYHWSRHYL